MLRPIILNYFCSFRFVDKNRDFSISFCDDPVYEECNFVDVI